MKDQTPEIKPGDKVIVVQGKNTRQTGTFEGDTLVPLGFIAVIIDGVRCLVLAVMKIVKSE